MKKFRVQDKSKRDGRNIVGTYDSMQEANDVARTYLDENDDVMIFDLAVVEIEVAEPYDHVKSYEDACRVLDVEPMDEQAMTSAGFRADEIARRKLETITAALNEGWKPDWNDRRQAKYVPWFWIEPRPDQTPAGLAYASTNHAPTHTDAHIGSRLCFKNAAVARYAANQFTELYALILVENY